MKVLWSIVGLGVWLAIMGCSGQPASQQPNESGKAKSGQELQERRMQAKNLLDRATMEYAPADRIRLARKALEIDPTFGQAYEVIGYACKSNHDFDQAYQSFTKAVEATPTLAYSYYERALINLFVRLKPENSLADFKQVVKYDPKSYIGYFAQGMIASSRKKYDDSINAFNQTLELLPEYTAAYYYRSLAYSQKQDFKSAIRDGKMFLKLAANKILWRTNYYNKS